VEGYVEELRLDYPLADNRTVGKLIEWLKEEKSAKSQTVEGVPFSSVSDAANWRADKEAAGRALATVLRPR
jgi:hypothetical protein